MFVHHSQLPHLLPPQAYCDQDWYDNELRNIFRKQWHPFCLAEQLRVDGDRFAGNVHGVPVVVIRRQGRLFALKNVCAHRHSLIAPDGVSAGPVLKCQIHGWEYQDDGKVIKLPDGRSFHGFKTAGSCLQAFRAEQAGPLVFVNLEPVGPSYREQLGGFATEFDQFYSHVRHVKTWSYDVPVNWKVIVENAVESYHVPMIHPETFEDYRPEELHDHALEKTYSRYGDLLPYEDEKGLEALAFRVYSKLLLKNPCYRRFAHVHLYPHSLLYFGDIYRGYNYVVPLGPENSRLVIHSFVPADIRWGFAGKALQDLSMVVFLRAARRIVQEDVDRWPPVQQGLRHAPFPGVLSCREERVFGIQRYVAEQLGMPVPPVKIERDAPVVAVPASSPLP